AKDTVIVATSTLELGIDIGDLDRVIQIDAPRSVSSFLQRLGRTGRRPGTSRNTLFLSTSLDGLLDAAAVLLLWKRGFVEKVVAP
ncbi:ATP-dependent helicase, partial [Mycobacterium sp. ITM-2017-0098]